MCDRTDYADNLTDLLHGHQHICWYPSAGADFRPLLFLSEAFYSDYAKRMGREYPEKAERMIPDLFVFSDMDPTARGFYIRRGLDGREYESAEEIRSDVGLLKDEKHWVDTRTLFLSEMYHKTTSIRTKGRPIRYECPAPAYYMHIMVSTRWYGTEWNWKTKLLYIIGTNETFYEEILSPKEIQIEMIVQHRKKELIAETFVSKNWETFDRLGTHFYIAERAYGYAMNVDRPSGLEEFYSISRYWNTRDDMVWYRVKQKS